MGCSGEDEQLAASEWPREVAEQRGRRTEIPSKDEVTPTKRFILEA